METQYDVDFVLMRYAEVMLNYAETANETGDLATATSLLKQIRMRAGIEPGKIIAMVSLRVINPI
ncbi:RagB/SusD family nutrient uptake outer membrane protein [Sphingobacterium sp. E70]|uniref:RagB/SusD family nutrient uptake outer membrane protein n=1 Tax=Sphingobacterium sp. E70 TaxID=2853439 RepID=UPI00211B83AC|nr:RagB/SusD family nutrient uptake outer membrane protein [Sphingobacterium sp. E70]ULT28111.1 RagB/SusD family nutrient uptake outer membrane protein [Sphingobacterium sp. E70]